MGISINKNLDVNISDCTEVYKTNREEFRVVGALLGVFDEGGIFDKHDVIECTNSKINDISALLGFVAILSVSVIV